MVGGPAVNHTSNLQGATELNVSECEYNALTHGAAHGLGLRPCMADLGFEMSPEDFERLFSGESIRMPPWFGTPETRANTISVASGEKWQQHKPLITSWTSSQRQQAEKHWNGTREHFGLRHVHAPSSQKELRLESVEHSHPMLACEFSSDQAQQFSYDQLANMD